MSNRYLVFLLAGIVLVSVAFNFIQYEKMQDLQQIIVEYKNQSITEYKKQNINNETISKVIKPTPVSNPVNQSSVKITPLPNANDTNFLSISAVAVRPILQSDGFFETTSYVGTVLKITVEIRDGTGLVLVNTATPTGVDFQTSARTAVMIAQNYTHVDLTKKDVIFSISSQNQELQAVDGGSAGGAMTVLLISDISGKPINSKVLMTGTIQDDGAIGEIGGVSEKADAAGKYGAKIFLVPVGQAVTQVQSCNERTEGAFTYRSCTSQEVSLSELTEKQYGMKVVEINNIKDALSYFNSNST
ncbi:MAG TPA: S16 family serine protease [Candidatus Nitrosotalea sp.]|nr:S16 family serine protease [Candidatus Nitrosotalea sp.]